jgi:hypothetical protein
MTKNDPMVAFAAGLNAMNEALDWSALADLYCHDGGGSFFADEQREAIQDAGLLFAGDLGDRLGRFGKHPARSLYVGSGVAEIVPILFESIVLARDVRLVNIPGPEVSALNAAFEAAEAAAEQKLPRFKTDPIDPEIAPRIDHLWFVSVLTDPEAFPALHDQLYKRQGTRDAVGGGHPKAERKAALELCLQAAAKLTSPAILTTTDEELPMLTRACADLKLDVKAPETARLSGIVGDAVRHCHIRPVK